MEALVLLIVLAVLVYLANIAWRTTEAGLQGLVSGVRVSWRLVRAATVLALRFYVWVMRWADVLQLEAARRLHAAYWCRSYLWRRAYIADRLRRGRRTGRYVR